MIKIEGVYKCRNCKKETRGTNIVKCPSCESPEVCLQLSKDDSDLILGVMGLAEKAGGNESYFESSEFFRSVGYEEAYDIVNSAKYLLITILKEGINNTNLGRDKNSIGVISKIGIEVGEFATALERLANYVH